MTWAVTTSETMQVGAVISSRSTVEIPLPTRNYIERTELAPGVVATANPSSMNSGQPTTGGGRPYVNGNRKEANNFQIDGLEMNDLGQPYLLPAKRGRHSGI